MFKNVFQVLSIGVTLLFISGCTSLFIKSGSIYGIVTVKETAEPMRATGVELYHDGALLLKTVTYDDGHYEFENLSAGEYKLKVVASGYADAKYDVIVESGRTARADMQLELLTTYMTVRTLAADEIKGDRATLNGTYTVVLRGYEPQEVGFVYSASPYPSNSGTKVTSYVTRPFSNEISKLKKGKYYFQAYAKNIRGIAYGEVLSLEINGQPSVTTLGATNVAETTATLNGRIDYEGDPAYSERGFVYSASFPNPTIDDPASATTKVVVSGTSMEFSANIDGLTKKMTYYVRAYAINDAGVAYGSTIEVSNFDYVVLSSDGIMVHKNDISSGASWSAAYNLCKNSAIGNYADWRLPTIGESEALYSNKEKLNINSSIYWTSEVYGVSYSYCFDFGSGRWDWLSNSGTYRVRCVRTLK